MICPMCGEDKMRLITVYRKGEKQEGCPGCINVVPLIDPMAIKQIYKDGKIMRHGHYQNIIHRKRNPITGEVYQDRGRSSMVVQGVRG